MPVDIRDKPLIRHEDVLALNFINSATPYVFRKHFRQGLRSHVMEILDPQDLTIEREGTVVDGMRWFPTARPLRILRIFRSRLPTLDKALNEIGRVKTVEHYLAPQFMATSVECIVDYVGPEGRDLVLCGFQEFVKGCPLDPWTILDSSELLSALHAQLAGDTFEVGMSEKQWIASVRRSGMGFVERVKQMVIEAGTIPDLAGAGNLIVTATGEIRLVDINNISPAAFDGPICLDEKGYPVSDKSVEALCLIQEKVAGLPIETQDSLFKQFFNPKRWKEVKRMEALFWENQATD